MTSRTSLISGVFGAAIFSAFLGLWLWAPQVFLLWREGFPPLLLSPKIETVTVAGAEAHPMPRRLSPLPTPARKRFDESQGLALIVVREGRIVHEAYGALDGQPIHADTLLNSYSLVKSLVGLLVLIGIEEGRVPPLETSLREILGPDAPDVRLAEVLSMRSGLSLTGEPPKDEKTQPTDDAAFSPFSPVARLQAYGVAPLLPRLEASPDLRGAFHYQSVNTALLGAVLERQYGENLNTLLSRKIWRPAGARDGKWRVTPGGGGVSAWCCLYARAEDWARVAAFVLRNGETNAPLLSEPLWQAWLRPTLAEPVDYLWQLRHDVLDRAGEATQGRFAYMAGHQGQRVYLLPEQDAAVVRFGAAPQLLHSTLYELFP